MPDVVPVDLVPCPRHGRSCRCPPQSRPPSPAAPSRPVDGLADVTYWGKYADHPNSRFGGERTPQYDGEGTYGRPSLTLRDDLRIDERGRLAWIQPPPRVQDLSGLSDRSGILAEPRRIQLDLSNDHAGAIGSAEQLIEATAKTVLRERGLPIDENAKIPALVKQTQKAPALDASATTPGPDGTDAVKKILGGVAAIAVGITELRNRRYGTGHGQTSAPNALGARHAHLAANAALTRSPGANPCTTPSTTPRPPAERPGPAGIADRPATADPAAASVRACA
ncbi:abortive infection family protein [Kitasatospora purpeofusca]|uniref:abortive infection family protein n=1 Tax=Kitasatospora purpeofusca TaxID=67352 RepID=UPI0030F2E75F